MTSGRILRVLALIGVLSLTGCRAWCERQCAPYNNCACPCAPQPCCAPASNYPVQAQPCAPAAPAWNVPTH